MTDFADTLAVKRALGRALGVEGDMSWLGLIGIARCQRAGLDGYRDAAERAGQRANRLTAMLPPTNAIVLDLEHDAVLIDSDGDRWEVVLRGGSANDLIMGIPRVHRDYGPLTLAAPGR